jgi:hypothetical protein
VLVTGRGCLFPGSRLARYAASVVRLRGSSLYDALDVGILGCRGARSITPFNKEMETSQPEYLRHDSQSLARVKLTTLSLTMATRTDGALSSLYNNTPLICL